MVSCTRRANRPSKSWIPEEQIEWILAAWDLARVMTVRGGFRAGGRGRLEGLDQAGRSLAVAGSRGANGWKCLIGSEDPELRRTMLRKLHLEPKTTEEKIGWRHRPKS